MYNRLYKFLETNNLIYSLQFGFRQKHSTSHALIHLTDKIREQLDKGNFACGIFKRLQLDCKLASLAKWLCVCLRTKWLWVRVQLQSLKLQISHQLQPRSSLTFRQLYSVWIQSEIKLKLKLKFTLKCIRDMTRTYSVVFLLIFNKLLTLLIIRILFRN